MGQGIPLKQGQSIIMNYTSLESKSTIIKKSHYHFLHFLSELNCEKENKKMRKIFTLYIHIYIQCLYINIYIYFFLYIYNYKIYIYIYIYTHTLMKRTCWSSNRASEWGRKGTYVTLNVEWFFVSDGVWQFFKNCWFTGIFTHSHL